MFFQRKNSKKGKDTDGSPRRESSRGKSDLLDRAKEGFGAIAGSFHSIKNGVEEFQDDMQSGIESILHKGSGILDKAKEIGQSESSHYRELEEGSEEQGEEHMNSFHSVLHKVKHDVKEETRSLVHALHLGHHHHHESEEQKPEADEQAYEAETTENVYESGYTNKTEDSRVVEEEQAVEEISSVQVQPDTAQTETPNEAPAETSAQAEKPEAAGREAEKDDPTKRIGFLGFFARLFERCCSPGDKKKD